MGQKQSNFEIFRDPIRQKVQFLWIIRVKQAKLSKNVVREICEYMHLQEVLVAVTRKQVLRWECGAEQWEVMYAHREIRVSNTTAYVCLNATDVFVCGGDDSSSVYLLTPTSTRVLPSLSTPRGAPGLFHIPSQSCIYTFGGEQSVSMDSPWLHSSSERFFLDSSAWSPLPAMHSPRAYFNPCASSGVLYLCGGRCVYIETLDPVRLVFTLVKFTLPRGFEIWDCSAVANDSGVIVFVGDQVIYLSKRPEICIKTDFTPGNYHNWSNLVPVSTSEVVYFVGFYRDLQAVGRRIRLNRAKWLEEIVAI